MKYALLSIMLVLTIVVVGCGDDSSTAPRIAEPALRTVPLDGSAGVDPGDPFHIMFDEPVDTLHFHEWFYCLDRTSHDALVDSLHGGLMGMGHHHADSAAFYDRMHRRGIEGAFHWFDNGDSCDFQPTSPLHENTEYVMRFRHDMMNAAGGPMHHMSQPLNEDLTVRFRTRDHN